VFLPSEHVDCKGCVTLFVVYCDNDLFLSIFMLTIDHLFIISNPCS